MCYTKKAIVMKYIFMDTKKVLIIEDEIPMAKALRLKMQKEEIEVSIAYNGKEGIDFIEKESFDLIVCDLMMPVVDGFSVLEYLHEHGKNIPVIIASNISQGEDIERALSLGARDYFVKSDTPIVAIVAKVKSLLEE